MRRRHSGLTMTEAAAMVRMWPGHTAHWYGSDIRLRWGWIYRAFANACTHGLIRCEAGPRKGQWIYFPAELTGARDVNTHA